MVRKKNQMGENRDDCQVLIVLENMKNVYCIF